MDTSLAIASGTVLWRFLCGSGPVPKAIARLIDTLSNHVEIKNDLSRAKVQAEVATIGRKPPSRFERLKPKLIIS
jgi:hypothetical protein